MTSLAVLPAMRKQKGRSAMHHKSDAPIRHMEFRFGEREVKAHFYDDNPLVSMYFLMLSVVVPYGEELVIDTVRHHRDDIRDPELRARMTGLIGQEAMHTRAHEEHNLAFQRQGYPMAEWDQHIKTIYTMLLKDLPNPMKLSLMAAVEHLTGSLSNHIMAHPELIIGKMDESVRDIWLWHMLEENEHKSIAYDVFQAMSGNYLLRVAGFVPACFSVFAVVTGGAVLLMHTDGSLWKPRNLVKHAQGLSALFGLKGVYGGMIGELLDYFRPSFHPDDYDTSELVSYWRERLLNADGELTPSLKKVTLPRAR